MSEKVIGDASDLRAMLAELHHREDAAAEGDPGLTAPEWAVKWRVARSTADRHLKALVAAKMFQRGTAPRRMDNGRRLRVPVFADVRGKGKRR